MRRHKKKKYVCPTLLKWYALVGLMIAIVVFFDMGLHPSSPGCEFFCSSGFSFSTFIGAIIVGIFWLPLLLLITYYALIGGWA